MDLASKWDWLEAPEVFAVGVGKSATLDIAGRRLAVFHIGDGFRALDNACPHRGGPLGAGWIEGDRVHCPMHGWAFDIATGACLDRPDKPVRSYPVELRDGRAFIGFPKDAQEPDDASAGL